MTPEQERALALARARKRRAEDQAPRDVRQEYADSPWYQQIPQAADDIIRATANGLTFGFADKIAGALSGTGTEAQRALSDEARKRAGGAYTAGELAGGVRTALSLGNSGLTLLGRGGTSTMTGIGGLGARTGLAAVEGAGYGALDALGNDRDVTTGAALGAGFGAAGNAIGEGVYAVANALRGPQARAQDLINKQAVADALTPDIAAQRLQELGPSAIVADLGPNVGGQARAIASTPGEGNLAVRNALSNRAAGATGRVSEVVNDAFGGPQNVLALADDIVARRKGLVDPLYEASRNVPVPMNDTLSELLSRPSSKSAIEQARKNMLDRGEVFDLSRPTVGMIDAVKKALDDVIEPARRAGENAKASSVTKLKDSIVEFADAVSPDYKQARQIFSSETAVKEALEEGVKAFDNNMTPDALARHLANLDEASREAYEIGARQKVANVMGTARNDAKSVRDMFGKGYNAEKLRIMLGEEGAEQILRGLSSEGTFQATRNRVLGGSDTIPKSEAMQTIAHGGSPGFFKSLANVNVGDAAASLGDTMLGGALAARREATNAELAKLLMSNNPNAIMPSQRSPAIRDNVARALIGSYVGGN